MSVGAGEIDEQYVLTVVQQVAGVQVLGDGGPVGDGLPEGGDDTTHGVGEGGPLPQFPPGGQGEEDEEGHGCVRR